MSKTRQGTVSTLPLYSHFVGGAEPQTSSSFSRKKWWGKDLRHWRMTPFIPVLWLWLVSGPNFFGNSFSHVSAAKLCHWRSEEFWSQHFAFSCCSFVKNPVCKGLKSAWDVVFYLTLGLTSCFGHHSHTYISKWFNFHLQTFSRLCLCQKIP